jgi:hypothetical protein
VDPDGLEPIHLPLEQNIEFQTTSSGNLRVNVTVRNPNSSVIPDVQIIVRTQGRSLETGAPVDSIMQDQLRHPLGLYRSNHERHIDGTGKWKGSDTGHFLLWGLDVSDLKEFSITTFLVPQGQAPDSPGSEIVITSFSMENECGKLKIKKKRVTYHNRR